MRDISSRTLSRARRFRPLRRLVLVLLLLFLLPYALTPLYLVGHPVSTLMLWRWAKGERVERVWTPLDRIAPILPLSVIVAEDTRFCTHHGVDLTEMREAIGSIDNLDDIGDVRGGSTITQQTVKNLFLWPGRSYVRKVLEFPLALWVDFVLPKRRIMELYLNIAEWGPSGQFGAEAGAHVAFGKSARTLTPREAALLAATLPNPHLRRPGRPGPGLRRLAGIYQGRAATWRNLDACLRRR
jgi:monofunctional biosynthetic peptidoglycan transglycosylase